MVKGGITPLMPGLLSGFILCRSCTAAVHLRQSSGSYILYASSSDMFPEPCHVGGFDTGVLFRAEHLFSLLLLAF